MKKRKIKKPSLAKLDHNMAYDVKERANFACQVCGKYHNMVNVHHIIPKRGYPELRYDVRNLICLCPGCHKFSKRSAHNNGLWFSIWLQENRPEIFAYLKEKV